ncbi:AAA family ATPase [Streptomyces sp. NPDC006132]|uniref:AAA family ATPase n=1 Tax=Streptomyces sp. NPDC006132 TaxID=3156732 RepID=UPI0033CCDC1A
MEKLQAHYGFERMPFGRNLAPGMLHRHDFHNQAVARISWCIAERSIRVVTGEVGVGKTVSVRTCLDALDPSKYSVVYIPNPVIGVRGIHEVIVNTSARPPPTGISSDRPDRQGPAGRTQGTQTHPRPRL